MAPPETTIYLDSAATTAVDRSVKRAMGPWLGRAGNASSLHRDGTRAAMAVEQSRARIARALDSEPDRLVFTSGGTEGNNFVLKGSALARRERGQHLLVSPLEHPSIIRSAAWLERQGWEVGWLPVDGQGRLDLRATRPLLRDDTVLVSIAPGNHEIGTLQPIEELGALCRERDIWLHVDACQSFTKVPLPLHAVDLVTLNGHKLHGPTGVGAVWLREGVRPEPLLHGGNQEGGRRGGTYNVAGIVGFAEAVRQARPEQARTMARLRRGFISRVLETLPTTRLNGSLERSLCHVVSLTFPGLDARLLSQALDRRGVRVSTGSACASSKPDPSAVLLAIGLSPAEARATLRFSLCRWTREAELRQAARHLTELVREARERA